MGLKQKEAIMQATTSWEEVGIAKGIESGQRSLISLQLEQKLGELPRRLSDRVNDLSPEQLKMLAVALLEFGSVDDLATWLENQS
jgi:Domain of unknown function (DUF4351)